MPFGARPSATPGTAPADTFRILSAPRSDAPPVGRAFHEDFRLFVEASEEGLVDGALEVGYEEQALPVLRSAPDGCWLEVSFAFDGDGEPRTGWVDRDHPGLEYHSWDGWLREQGALFFADPDSITFFTAPDGDPRERPLEPTAGSLGFDYAMYPVSPDAGSRSAGGERWMEVRVVSPSDHCSDPDSAPESSLEERVWIRYLTDAGRPRVWYFTRGC